jgi:hypothetical protein
MGLMGVPKFLVIMDGYIYFQTDNMGNLNLGPSIKVSRRCIFMNMAKLSATYQARPLNRQST